MTIPGIKCVTNSMRTLSLTDILRRLRVAVRHEPNDLMELYEDFPQGLPDDLAAVVIVYRNGMVSWYAAETDLDKSSE